jgi:Arc/MetJ family transcription regulator
LIEPKTRITLPPWLRWCYNHRTPVCTNKTAMRTNIETDDALVVEALVATGRAGKRVSVEAASRAATQQKRIALCDVEGIGWKGDLTRSLRRSAQQGPITVSQQLLLDLTETMK